MAEPKSYKCRFIEPGLISYEDSKQGTVFVSREALDRMGPSFRNCPVIFIPEQHDDSDKTTAFNFNDIGSNPASGIVTGIPEWGNDGWQYVDVSIWDENAQKAIKNGYSVSCAYFTDEEGEGGERNQIPYDAEIINGHYMHMAIVPRPRYEGSRIYANSKGGNALNIFKKKTNMAPPAPAPAPAKPDAPAPVPEKEEKENGCGGMKANGDEVVDINGTKVPLYELVEAYQMKQGHGGGADNELSPEDEVALPDGTMIKVADLIASYSEVGTGGEGETLENAETVESEGGVAPVDEGKQKSNAAPAKPVAKPAAPRVVNATFKNAARNPAALDPRDDIETEDMRLARGKANYSIPVANEGGK